MKKRITYDKAKSSRDISTYPVDYESIKKNYKTTKPIDRKLKLDETGDYLIKEEEK